MFIHHKFKEVDFGKGFQTHNAVLDVTPYKPEVLVLGTFNPNTPGNPFVDFFYGRNYFWTGLKNLFVHNKMILKSRRISGNTRKLVQELNPALEEILEICTQVKITFADLITDVFPNQEIILSQIEKNNVTFNGREYDLINDGDLNALNNLGQVQWSTQTIIEYLKANPLIKHVYFTRQPNGVWGAQWNTIRTALAERNIIFTNIFTPSGMGLGAGPRMQNLLHSWVHNRNPNFGKLSHSWLIKNEVNPNNF